MFTNYNFELKIVFDSSFYAKIMITFIDIHTYIHARARHGAYIHIYVHAWLPVCHL